MERLENLLIAGAGAIGLTVAHRVYQSDPRCIRMLAPGNRAERYHGGFVVNGERLDIALATGASPTKADLVIVATKYHHLPQVIVDLAPFVGPETIILSLLNGITSEDILAAAFGRPPIPLGMILGVDSQNVGVAAASYDHFGVIHFGPSTDLAPEGGAPAVAERDRLLRDFFDRHRVPYVYHEGDMLRALWYKFMINVGANQVTALLRLNYGRIKRGSPTDIPEARELVRQAMLEVIAVANAQGIDLGENDLGNWETTLSSLDDRGYTSMCQDVLAGRKTEVEMFARALGELGKQQGIPTPVNDLLYLALRSAEQNYA
jgi:2-dehydropantoate 2-reductase